MTMVDKKIKVRESAVMGDLRYGAPGGGRTSSMFILSYAVADELARELGIAAEEAHRMVIAFGKVSQKLLLKGTPIGIPHLGTIILHQARKTINPHGIIASLAARGITANLSDKVTSPLQKKVVIKMPPPLKRVFMDNALYSGSLSDHRKAATEKLKARLKQHKGGGLKHRASPL
jgi:hypothetical protein